MWEMAFPGVYIDQNLKIFRGFAPGPHWGAYSAPQPPAVFSLASLGISGG